MAQKIHKLGGFICSNCRVVLAPHSSACSVCGEKFDGYYLVEKEPSRPIKNV